MGEKEFQIQKPKTRLVFSTRREAYREAEAQGFEVIGGLNDQYIGQSIREYGLETGEIVQTNAMKNVNMSIMAMQAFSTNTLPQVRRNRRGKCSKSDVKRFSDEIDNGCLAMNMMYARLLQSIDVCLTKPNNYAGNEELRGLLEKLKEDCIAEQENFRSKAVTYRNSVLLDKRSVNNVVSWLDIVHFIRSDCYDLDENSKDFKVSKGGANVSDLLIIEKKTPKTEENPKGKEKIYFRKEDNTGPANDNNMVLQILKNGKFSIADKHRIERAFESGNLLTDKKAFKEFCKKIVSERKDKTTPQTVARNAMKKLGIEDLYKSADKVTRAEYGQFFLNLASQWNLRHFAVTNNIGPKIDNNRNLSNRHVATSRLATVLGIQDSVCESHAATIKKNGKLYRGNVMEESGGKTTNEVADTGVTYSPEAISRLFSLVAFDILCGQVDRHFNNFHLIVKDENVVGVKALDNDLSFGKLPYERIKHGYNRIREFNSNMIEGLPVDFLNKLMVMDRPYLEQILGDLIKTDEIDFVMDRLHGMQEAIIDHAQACDHMEWDPKTRKISYTGLYADEEYRQLCAYGKLCEESKDEKGGVRSISLFDKRMLPTKELKNRLLNRREQIKDKIMDPDASFRSQGEDDDLAL